MKNLLVAIVSVVLFTGCASTRERAVGLVEDIKVLSDKLDEVKDVLHVENKEEAPDEALPFEWSEVEWCSGDADPSAWKQTLIITVFNLGKGDRISWAYKDGIGPTQLGWKPSNRISCSPNAVIGWVTHADGKWLGAQAAEWLPERQEWQSRKVFQSERGDDEDHDYILNGALEHFQPSSGQEFWVFVSGLNWKGLANVQERSQCIKVKYP